MKLKENRCAYGDNPEPSGSGRVFPLASSASFFKVSQQFPGQVQLVVVCGVISVTIISIVIISPV